MYRCGKNLIKVNNIQGFILNYFKFRHANESGLGVYALPSVISWGRKRGWGEREVNSYSLHFFASFEAHIATYQDPHTSAKYFRPPSTLLIVNNCEWIVELRIVNSK